jgi:predicted ATP-dependent endonuclease of OLD family
MFRLSSVVIRRFKRLAEFEIPLGDVTLLVGANNAGKSSVLQAIHFAVSIAQTARLVGEGISWQKDKFELSFNPAQLLYSPVADVLSLATGGALQEPRQSQIEIELCSETNIRCTVG